MTYDELVTNIRNYTEVDANVFTNAVINTFITMAENRILRDIDLDVFRIEATGTSTKGNRFLAAPSTILTQVLFCLGSRHLLLSANAQC
jgi:hypothetical protein